MVMEEPDQVTDGHRGTDSHLSRLVLNPTRRRCAASDTSFVGSISAQGVLQVVHEDSAPFASCLAGRMLVRVPGGRYITLHISITLLVRVHRMELDAYR